MIVVDPETSGDQGRVIGARSQDRERADIDVAQPDSFRQETRVRPSGALIAKSATGGFCIAIIDVKGASDSNRNIERNICHEVIQSPGQ